MIFISGLLYNTDMLSHSAALQVLLEDAVSRDRTTARRLALLNTLLHERYLTRSQLITRVEGKLGKGCFGYAAWKDTFYRDMSVVKRALRAAGYHLAYSRKPRQNGYYLRDQPTIDTELASALNGSIKEIDPNQINILKQLSFKQRFQQGCSVTNLACQVVAHRMRLRNIPLNTADSYRLAIQRDHTP